MEPLRKITFKEAKDAFEDNNRTERSRNIDRVRAKKGKILTKESDKGSLYLRPNGTLNYDFKNVDDASYVAKENAKKSKEWLEYKKEAKQKEKMQLKQKYKLIKSLETDEPKYKIITDKMKKYLGEYLNEKTTDTKKEQLSKKFNTEKDKLNALFLSVSLKDIEKIKKGGYWGPISLPFNRVIKLGYLSEEQRSFKSYKEAKNEYIKNYPELRFKINYRPLKKIAVPLI